MISKSKIRRASLATLIVFVTAGIVLQPLLFISGSDCTCNAGVFDGSNLSAGESSCCTSAIAVEEQNSCCPAKLAMAENLAIAEKCCCTSPALGCESGGCGCSDVNGSQPSLPAIPTHKTPEAITPTLICAAPFLGYPRENEIKRVDYSNSVAEFTALSSQQICVLLSRFTC